MDNIVAYQKEEGIGNNRHTEIQFYSHNQLIRIWTDKNFEDMIPESIRFLNLSNLPEAIYFQIKPSSAAYHCNFGEMLLVYALQVETKAGIWFTIQFDGSQIKTESMTNKITALDISTNIVKTDNVIDFISLSDLSQTRTGFKLWFFAH